MGTSSLAKMAPEKHNLTLDGRLIWFEKHPQILSLFFFLGWGVGVGAWRVQQFFFFAQLSRFPSWHAFWEAREVTLEAPSNFSDSSNTSSACESGRHQRGQLLQSGGGGRGMVGVRVGEKS